MKSLTLTLIAVATAAAGVNAQVGPTVPVGIPAAGGQSALCDNKGLEYAYYTDDFDFRNASYYPKYDPTVLKRSKAINQTGVTTSLIYQSYDTEDPQPVYQDHPDNALPSIYFALNHRGYLYAEYTGFYTFTTSQVDDLAFLWIGSQAFSGWTRGNANDIVQFDSSDYVPGSDRYGVNLVEGFYYPIRIVYKQGDGNALWDFNIVDPAGQELLGDFGNPGESKNIFRYSCDGLAPHYPPFGKET